MKLKNFTKAISAFNTALSKDPYDESIWYNKGLTLATLAAKQGPQNITAAAQDIEAALQNFDKSTLYKSR